MALADEHEPRRMIELCKRDEERRTGEGGGEMKEKREVFNVRGPCKVRRGLVEEGGKVTGKVTIIYLITDPSHTHIPSRVHTLIISRTHSSLRLKNDIKEEADRSRGGELT